MFLSLADDVPCVYFTRDPAQDAKQNVDEEVGAAAASHGDREEGNPYREEVEEDCALWEDVLDCASRLVMGWLTVLDGILKVDVWLVGWFK